MATHEQINKIINDCAKHVCGDRLVAIATTARQWQRMGLSAQVIAHLVGCVPVR